MDIVKRVKEAFSGIYSEDTVTVGTDLKLITSKMVTEINNLSQFSTMDEPAIYEQLHVWEPDIGGGIDKMSSLVSRSFKEFYVKDAGSVMDDKEKKMIKLAADLSEIHDIHSMLEGFTEILYTQGNLFVPFDKDGSYTILPNKYVSIVDKEDRIGQTTTDIMRTSKILLLYENEPGLTTERFTDFIHIKYKTTPIFQKDLMGRTTFGMYSISPLQRLVLTTWWKRQTMIIDILWRWRNVPREHHKLDSTMFSLDRYTGSKSERLSSARTDAASAISTYIAALKDQKPDQGYVSLDNMSIEMVESKSKYMSTNALMEQLDEKTWVCLNIPQSVVNGKGTGSYASEMIISNYVSSKVIQIANKFKPIVLRLIRSRIKEIDPTLPVDRLDMKFELVMATNQLEVFREAAIMVTLNAFTDDEVREFLGFLPLTDDQRQKLINNIEEKTVNDVRQDVVRSDSKGDLTQPATPQSDLQRKSDIGERVARRAIG